MKSGFVSLIGRPNVGKSTLLNTLVNAHVAITSDKAGTTRNIIEGIYNDNETQIVFVDTPGIHKPVNQLGKVMNKEASSLTKDVDVILFLVDGKTGLGKGDQFILNTLNGSDIPVILVINKSDGLKEIEILQRIVEYKNLYDFAEIVPISALNNDNVDQLISVIKKYLTNNVKYYDEEAITNCTKYFMISEYVREKLLNKMNEEIPHSITCVTSNFTEDDKIARIMVDIIVDRDSLKKIIIGKNGDNLKQVGTEARKDIEELKNKKVFLELYVKTIENWREKEHYLNELGFKNNE